MNRIRLKIGLRLMLLLMALACVLSAYVRTLLDLRRENARTELMALENAKRNYESELWYRPQNKSKLAEVNTEIDEKLRVLGKIRPKEK